MAAVHRAVQGRRLRWDEDLPIDPARLLDPESPLSATPPGTRCTIRELLRLMMTVSDNVATNLLIDRLGMAPINALLAEMGLRDTVLRRRMLDQAARARGEENWTTPADMARFMAVLHARGLRGSAAMRRLLSACRDREKIPDHLPPGTPVANKPGELPGLRADVALVEGPSGPFVIAVFLDGLADDAAGDGLIGAIARRVYEAF